MRVNAIKGIGPKREKQLNETDIYTVKDLVQTLPKRYIIRSLSTLENLSETDYEYIEATLTSEASVFFIRKKLSRLTFKVSIEDHTFSVSVFNQHYLKRVLRFGVKIVLLAKRNTTGQSLTASKVFLKANFKTGYEPVYNIPDIADGTFYKLIKQALDVSGGCFEDLLPDPLLAKYDLLDYTSTIKIAHHPKTREQYEAVRKRLKYQELFFFQMRLRLAKHQRKQALKRVPLDHDTIEQYINRLPYALTNAQSQAIKDILHDFEKNTLMYRMLQGDTGSGKTLVAVVAAVAVMAAGGQVAFMAPTDILARQHYQTVLMLLEQTPYAVALLTQSVEKNQQDTILEDLADGTINLVVGTHKLYADNVQYHNLTFIVTDEQHRFGVNQRLLLRKKGELVDTLYLSATPIPRTLAHTLFGDMDQSILDEKPNHLTPITTEAYPLNQTKTLRHRIKTTLENKEQIFVVSPNIETNDAVTYSAERLHKSFKNYFKEHTVALLHGKIPKDQQTDILAGFQNKTIDILVATTIIEVGIDFPNATLMLIYHAERLGFAQLHQLRGRVGRGDKPGHCVLVYAPSQEAQDRMTILEKTSDGFVLSEYDLQQRGHGDLIGTLQSGYLPFDFVDLTTDMALFKHVKNDVETYFKPVFIEQKQHHAPLRKQLMKSRKE